MFIDIVYKRKRQTGMVRNRTDRLELPLCELLLLLLFFVLCKFSLGELCLDYARVGNLLVSFFRFERWMCIFF